MYFITKIFSLELFLNTFVRRYMSEILPIRRKTPSNQSKVPFVNIVPRTKSKKERIIL